MVSAVPAKVTAARLRTLARLHRGGVEGAGDELVQLAHDAPTDLAAVLGRDQDWLLRVRVTDLAAGALSAAIESRARDVRRGNKSDARHRAAVITKRLASTCDFDPEGAVVVDAAVLFELVKLKSHRWLGFVRGRETFVIHVGLLKTIFARSKRTAGLDVRVVGDCLRISYRTERGRGRFRLRLWPRNRTHEDVLTVALPTEPVVKAARPRHAPAPTTPVAALQAKGSDVERLPVASARRWRRGGLLGHLLSAFNEAVGS